MLKNLKESNAGEEYFKLIEENEKLKNVVKQMQRGPVEESFSKRSIIDNTFNSKEFFKKP